jgi:hypothetical protein
VRKEANAAFAALIRTPTLLSTFLHTLRGNIEPAENLDYLIPGHVLCHCRLTPLRAAFEGL